MEDPFAERKKLYADSEPGEVLFWKNDVDQRPAIRVILPFLEREFTDHNYVGRDPVGQICYNSSQDFPPAGSLSNYEVFLETLRGQDFVNVRFYKTDGKDIFAEFFAKDRGKAARKAEIAGQKRSATWIEAEFGGSHTRVKKPKGESKVTVTASSIHLKAEFNVDEEFKKKDVDVPGRLRFKDIDDIKKGVDVRWDADHLIFYKDDITSKEYTAYFMSLDYPEAFLEHFGDEDKVFSNVTWSDTKEAEPK